MADPTELDQFYSDVQELVVRRATVPASEALRQGPCVDFGTLKIVARLGIVQELELLQWMRDA